MKKIFFLLFVISLSPILYSQIAKNWKNYSDMKNVKSIHAAGTNIWAASDGGGFSYDLATNSFKTFNKADGLNGISLTSVTIDNYGKIWFGSGNGILDVYNPAENTFKTVLDIFNSDKSSKKINDLSVSGDTIIISSDFGISLVDSKNYFFYDTFFKFGDFLSNTRVNSALKSNLIYSATGLGLAIQKPDAQNLSAPESWNVYSTTNGLPSNNVLKIVNFGDMIITSTERGMAAYDGTSFSTFLPQFSTNYITDITSWENSLFFITDSSNVYSYDGGEPSLRYSSPDRSLTKVIYSPVFGILVSSVRGILRIESSQQDFLFPNGPQVNQFPAMSVDGNGNLWSASGTDVTGRGFYKFDGEKWTNYDTSNTLELPANSYFSVFTAPDNSVYVGSWGSGFVRIRDNVIENFNRENTGMQGIDDNPDFLLASGFKTDSKNNLWVLNYGAVDRRNLSVLTPQKWYHFSVDLSHYVEENFYLAIDQYDTKWFACRNQGRTGLYYFNENNTLDNTGDDKAGYITEANGLNTNSIYSVVTDRRGDVWVGTNLGVNIITNNQTILASGTPQLRISSVFSLRQQTINAIAVDPLNQKWIGTNQGLLLVNSDGTQLLATYNTKNSALLSDQITSIAIDENSGTLYVGTEEGLTSFETPAINPKESFEELFIYPNPFFLDYSSQQITIDGLIRDSELKVLTVTGKLVKELEANSPASPGGFRAFWDGRDENGELVSSGVYFIVAFDLEGNSVETGKIAVIRK
jgi:ligand-binding sensor domain-containing protein